MLMLGKRWVKSGKTLPVSFWNGRVLRYWSETTASPGARLISLPKKAGVVRFVEVKAVSRESLPDISREMDYRPEEMVTLSKLKKVARTAALYMEGKRDKREFQIDVVGVVLHEGTRTARCRLIEQALEDNL